MSKGRLEAFSDGVMAIILTILVFDLKPPDTYDFAAIYKVLPVFLTYVMSFAHLAIYWNNHHHMLHAADRINGTVLWANLHLFFWLSLMPFATGWLNRSGFASVPAALYGFLLLMAAFAYFLLETALIRATGKDSRLGKAIGNRWQEITSLVLYVAALPLAFVNPWISVAIYNGVAILWMIPDRRIEKHLG